MSEIIELTFTSSLPTLLLTPATPSEAPAVFAQVLVGQNGAAGNADDITGFATDPLAYYILAST